MMAHTSSFCKYITCSSGLSRPHFQVCNHAAAHSSLLQHGASKVAVLWLHELCFVHQRNNYLVMLVKLLVPTLLQACPLHRTPPVLCAAWAAVMAPAPAATAKPAPQASPAATEFVAVQEPSAATEKSSLRTHRAVLMEATALQAMCALTICATMRSVFHALDRQDVADVHAVVADVLPLTQSAVVTRVASSQQERPAAQVGAPIALEALCATTRCATPPIVAPALHPLSVVVGLAAVGCVPQQATPAVVLATSQVPPAAARTVTIVTQARCAWMTTAATLLHATAMLMAAADAR